MFSDKRTAAWIVVALACCATIGCGKKPAAKAMHGSVNCGGQQATSGQVIFVSADNASQPPIAASILSGEYRISGAGVPLGKYSIRVDARRKTGRKVKGNNGLEVTMVDEEVAIAPPIYASGQSPLTLDIHADTNEQFDITIPR